MALESVKISFKTLDQLIENSPFELVQSELSKFSALSPERAFPTDKMIKLKTNVYTTLSQYDEGGLSSDLLNLKNTIKGIAPQELSAILLGSYYTYSNFSVDSFDYSLQSLLRLNTNIMAFYSLLQGGCEVLRIALKSIRGLAEISLENSDFSDIVSSFFGSIASTLESIAEFSIKTIRDIANEIYDSAQNTIKSIYEALDKITNIQMKDIIDAVNSAANAIVSSIQNATLLLLSGIDNAFSALVSITEGCATATNVMSQGKLHNLKNNVNNIPSRFITMTPFRAQKLQKRLNSRITFNEQKASSDNVEFKKAQTAAFIRKFKENNPNAKDAHVSNAMKNTITNMNKENDYKVNTMMDKISSEIQTLDPKNTDIKRKSDIIVIDSAIGGRPIPDAEEIIAKGKTAQENNQVYDKSYFSGPYAATIAKKINLLHYKVRYRFANAMKELTENENLQKAGYTFSITSSLRTLKKQRALYNQLKPQGKAVAFPGNSWHNYGVAIDLAIFKNGNYVSSAGPYNGLAAPIFDDYALYNPIRNDALHFQPKELPVSARSLKAKLVTERQTINNEILSTLLV